MSQNICLCKSIFHFKRKGRDLTHSYEKSPYTHRKIQWATLQHKNATKNFDYKTIADRLRTVSWSNKIHPKTDVIKPVYERSTFPLTATAVFSKRHAFKNLETKRDVNTLFTFYIYNIFLPYHAMHATSISILGFSLWNCGQIWVNGMQ